MKRWISFSHKMKVLLSLAVVVVLLFVKDVMDKQNVTNLGSSFSSVYEDRLLPESYIYQMAEHLYHKRMLLDNLDQNGVVPAVHTEMQQHNSAIENIVIAFEKTRLTDKEAAHFTSLKHNIKKTVEAERAYLAAIEDGLAFSHLSQQIDHYFEASATNLKALSGIQLAEAKKLTDESKRIVAGSAILSRFEIVLLLIIALLLLALVITKNINQVPVARPELN